MPRILSPEEKEAEREAKVEAQRIARNEKKRIAREKEKQTAALRRQAMPRNAMEASPQKKRYGNRTKGNLNKPLAGPPKGVKKGEFSLEEFLNETSGMEMVRLATELLKPPISFGEFIQRTTNLPNAEGMGPIVLEPWQWHLCNRLEQLVHQRGQHIMVHKPPQHGGSILASMRLAAYLLGRDPLHRFRQVTHNQEHSEQFSQVIQDTVRTREYQEIFPFSQIPKQTNLREWSTLQRDKVRDGQPSYVSMGIQGAGVGIGGDTFLIDDPYGNPKDAYSVVINNDIRLWHNSLLVPRLTPQSNVIVLYHRFQPEDYAGWLEEMGGWEIIRYAALGDGDNDPMQRQYDEPLAPGRYPFEYLDALRSRDPMTFYGLYQGKPTAPEGNAIKRPWFQIVGDYDQAAFAEAAMNGRPYTYFKPEDIRSARIYFDVGASAAQTADRTVGTFGVKMADGSEVWLWQMAGQWDPADRDNECVRFCMLCRQILPALVVNIEEGFGLGADTVKRLAGKIEACGIKVKTDRVTGSKWARANDRTDSFMSVAQAGGIRFYAGTALFAKDPFARFAFLDARKNWIEPYLTEVCRLTVKQTDNGIVLVGGKDDRFDSGVGLHNKLMTEKKRMTGESMSILTERMFSR